AKRFCGFWGSFADFVPVFRKRFGFVSGLSRVRFGFVSLEVVGLEGQFGVVSILSRFRLVVVSADFESRQTGMMKLKKLKIFRFFAGSFSGISRSSSDKVTFFFRF